MVITMTKITTFTGTLLKKEYLTEDVILALFKIPKEFTFKAGQFITIRIKNRGQSKLKPYSILNPPSQKGQLDLCIKIIEGGYTSEIFQEMLPGDKFEFKGPFGHFIFDEKSPNKEHFFIGAGTGIVPLYSIIKEHLPQNPEKKFILLFGTKSQKNLLFHEELQQLEKKYAHFSYLPTLSREEWPGRTGHVQKHLPKDLKNKTFYICGLKELVLKTKDLLLSRGVKVKDVKFERYS